MDNCHLTGKLSLTKTLVSLAWQPAPMCHDKVALYSLQPKSEVKVYYHPPCTVLKMLLFFTALITMAPMSLFLLFYAYGCFACMSLCTTCAMVPTEARKVSDPLELEFQMAVNHCVGAENGSQVL